MRFFGQISFLFFLLISSHCRATLPAHLREPKIKPEINRNAIPVVFVPGIKGSILEDPNGSVRWLSATQALGLSTPDLRLAGEASELTPAGGVERVTLIPYIVDVALYGPWFEKMSSEQGIEFYVFSYDWRKDNLRTREKLTHFLEEIQKQYGKKPVLIGHSMGGMLSYSAVNQNPKLVEKLVLVGVPFRGGIGYMKDLLVGNPTGFNSKIQGPCMIAKYESVYGFFPRLGTNDSQGLVTNTNGRPLSLDFFQESAWRENRLGFYGQNCSVDEIPNPLEFQNILNRAKLFRESLDPSPSLLKAPPKVLIVNAQNRPTRKGFQRIKENDEASTQKQWDLEIVPREIGDGSVLLEHSLPQAGFPFDTVKTEYEHSVMLNDKNVQNKLLEFVKK
jgi:pimeloyl-ACP methyl ester carboxylesterase